MNRPWALRLLLVLAITAALPVVITVPASAHATLLFTSPAPESAVPSSPQAIQLVFDQEVVPAESAIWVESAEGRSWRVGNATSGHDGQTVTARLLDRLTYGAHVVRWEVAAQDGDVMIGRFTFAVGTTAGLSLGGATTETEGAAATAAFRWLLFLGLALSLGGVLGARLVRRTAPVSEVPEPAPWLGVGALAGVIAAAGTALLILGGGSVVEGLGRLSLADLLGSAPGRIAGTEVLAFAAAAALFLGRKRVAGALCLLVVPVAEGLRAHPQAAASGTGAVVTAVHLTAAALWLGALVHVVRVGWTWHRHGISATVLVSSYARLALWLFVAVALTGVAAVLLLLPADELASTLADTVYGRWLLAKVAAVGVVTALAVWARRRLRRRTNQPSRVMAAEVGVLAVVLAVSGLLTALTPPTRADQPLPFPPPPMGPVVAVGDRAGFIGIGVTASSNQLLVRLVLPDTSEEEESTGHQSFELTANVSSTGRAPRTVRFRRCGEGCFVAPFAWASGLNTVTLRATAAGWPGGTTALNVAWPPKPAADRLKAAVTAMRKVRRFTLHEQVTSDTTRGPGTLRKLAMSGRDFLDSEPYSSGVAPVATLAYAGKNQTTLALAYPGEGTYVLLTLARNNRIVRESLAAGTHLVSRTFVYPELSHARDPGLAHSSVDPSQPEGAAESGQ